LGFGGRILPVFNDEVEKPTNFKPPKYLNSPETAVFHKSQVLFGENMVREELECKSRNDKGASINKRSLTTSNSDIIVVEGYMDVITLNYIGIMTTVATMGTAISLDQVNAAAKLAAATGGKTKLCWWTCIL
jgi:DNA primase